ncbi:MAG: class I SAM-dependent DNA methyltransferase [Spiribacter salinus]|uniref:site-specific DNA-methyltransferase (adenine-specific) n=1 Tax=Spiribacter salinus TaxID=1335746 RepID=A0A540VP74_9GAMM|nr:MAG: class I SAM-dependent DNA methyltransferase [Spiribacter salinus]
MTPEAFVAKWDPSTLKESAGAQEHFIDLCRLVGVKTPAEADPEGEWFTFERGAKKAGGGEGWADVWRRGCFAWEYKGKHKDLSAAYRQLQRYGPALENPPLLIVSDMDRIQIHTSFTNTKQITYELRIQDLTDPKQRAYLEAAFTEPERLRPGETREYITSEAARKFAALAEELRQAGYERLRVAHFITRMLFCMFAEDIGILPRHLFTQMLEHAREVPGDFQGMASDLFGAMHRGGRVGFERVDWFNGGLFDDDDALPLNRKQIDLALAAAYLDWSAIEPSILGTLFERGMDPGKRGQLGAHYTDPATIHKLVYPVVIEPLEREWELIREEIATHMELARKNKDPNSRIEKAKAALQRFLFRLRKYTVLDPACGSGNFLYLSLKGLKDLEHRVGLEAESLGVPRPLPEIGVANMRGIEISPYAAELARVTLWIGEIQWMLEHGFSLNKNPILKPLQQIEERDALVTEAGVEAEWPEAEAIVGNPPFVGGTRLVQELDANYVCRLRELYSDSVPAGRADLVCYWFAKAAQAIRSSRSRRAGLVATNSIRHGNSRLVLDRITADHCIFEAWSDEPWVNEGASVRVSIIAFGGEDEEAVPVRLDGQVVEAIHSDLSAGADDFSRARKIPRNRGLSFEGLKKRGPFDIAGETAREWLVVGGNPNGRSNRDVLRPMPNARSLVQRPADRWVIDFGVDCPMQKAALYEVPFSYLKEHAKPFRQGAKQKAARDFWWLHWNARPVMRSALAPLTRFIVTPRVAKHRIFVWMEFPTLPDDRSVAIAREDDVSFGVLQCRIHELWALRMSSYHGGERPTYNPTTNFATFPFPAGLEPDRDPADFDNPHAEAIAEAARNLDTLRERWLNPPEWTERVPEVVEGYPDRVVAKPGCQDKLKQRTLTKLYNERPAWLDHAHRALDEAVAAAYGWDWPLDDETILVRLLELNLLRAKAEG